MGQVPIPLEEDPPPVRSVRGGHGRRPPLAEVDSWELWQRWTRGERGFVLPWVGLLVSFCIVLAAMYSFFFFSTRESQDPGGLAVVTVAVLALLVVLWRRISPRRGFALAVVALIAGVSGVAFGIWLLLYSVSGWNTW